MSPEAAQRTIIEMNRVCRRMREVARGADFHHRHRRDAVLSVQHAESVIDECLEEIR